MSNVPEQIQFPVFFRWFLVVWFFWFEASKNGHFQVEMGEIVVVFRFGGRFLLELRIPPFSLGR